MPSLSQMYTGKEAGFNPQPFTQTQRAGEQLQQGILGAKKAQVNQAIGEAKDFQELMELDPISSISNAVMQKQSEAIQEFEAAGVEMMRRSNGRLTENDKMMLRSMKNKLESDQAVWQADSMKMVQDMDMVSRNPARYDLDAMTGAYNNFINPKEGEPLRYHGQGVQIAPMSYANYQKVIQQRAGTKIQTESRFNPETGGHDSFVTNNWTPEEARDDYAKTILSDDAIWKSVAEGWKGLTDLKKQEYFSEVDLNNDGTIDDTDAIINYGYEERAKDTYMQSGYKARGTGTGGGSSKEYASQVDERERQARLSQGSLF